MSLKTAAEPTDAPPQDLITEYKALRASGLSVNAARQSLGLEPSKQPKADDGAKDIRSTQDVGALERRIKGLVRYVVKTGTNRIDRADIITAAHRMFKTGSPELVAAEKYRNLAEVAQGAIEGGSDRSSGGSSAPWSRTPATERQLNAMDQIRAAHRLTHNYHGSRILPLVLVDGLKIADVAKNLCVRKESIINALKIILGILSGADSKW